MKILFLLIFISTNIFSLQLGKHVSIHGSVRERVGYTSGKTKNANDMNNLLGPGSTRMFTFDLGIYSYNRDYLYYLKENSLEKGKRMSNEIYSAYLLNLRFLLLDRDFSHTSLYNHDKTSFKTKSYGIGYKFTPNHDFYQVSFTTSIGITKLTSNVYLTPEGDIDYDDKGYPILNLKDSSDYEGNFLLFQTDFRLFVVILGLYYQYNFGDNFHYHDFGIEIGVGF